MKALQVVLFYKPGHIDYHGKRIEVGENQLLMVGEDAHIHASSRQDWMSVFFYPGEVCQVYPLLTELVSQHSAARGHSNGDVKSVPVFDELVNVIEQLHKVSKDVMLRFVFTYCLEMDKPYFSDLLSQYSDPNDKVFDFMHQHLYEQWPVSRYAEMLGIEVTKLNTAFYKYYGQSTKSWLTQKRLSYAKQIILETNRKIADVAFDSGFSSHSHFIGAFKKRYQCSPSVLRSGKK
ncbi:helix-turn-helix transcriptional regulator [Vibrio ostreicida]|uniref:AraC family transcriptional regulator n=1 Tax=Vibrio ostreicida TaxID=526588 RepID=A0ABT8BSA1_9VIBR|nr:AraC family transcriptional regulator [Vibrio ostreicida]MDN3610016.1 AraC family transcriptional regulator [Vibrio ostreicida]MDN3611184.1 AraC family transcriptional regulator [Vibrio ostreicida]NPD10441.1 helix-turn-helix transcriptional regulator [Vibrio ostreicida]